MEQLGAQHFDQQRIRQLLSGVPFFNAIARDDPDEFASLERLARVRVVAPGEPVIRAGDVDSTLYFLLRGELEVLSPEPPAVPIYRVSAGEVFGTLSMVLEMPRSATIQVCKGREAVLAGLDFSLFNMEQGPFTLATRLAFYHMIVHHIRWTLEVKRMQSDCLELEQALRKVPMFKGEKGSDEELLALQQQAHALAELLCGWNEGRLLSEQPLLA